jgi:hypothetical protein
MTAGRYDYGTTTISGHRKVEIRCPECREMFAMHAGAFAQAKRRYPNSPIRCSDTCRRAHDRAKAAQRAEAQA